MKMFAYTMEHICSYGVTLQAPFEVIGETPLGLRINAYVTEARRSPATLPGRPAMRMP